MNVEITDSEALKTISVTDIATYIRSEGWLLKGFWAGKRASVWSKGEDKIVIPEDTSFADYSKRLSEVLGQLADSENRSELEIYNDILISTADVIRLRLVSESSADGSIRLEDGVRLFESAKDLLFSAARAAVTPKATFRSRLPVEAERYLRQVKLGQTERGSFIVTVISPVTPELQTSLLTDSVEDPYDRRVTRVLASSLSSVWRSIQIARLNNNFEPFEASIADGVSSNLCDALASIGESFPDSSTDIQFYWARNRTKPNLPSRVQIPSNSFPILRSASKILKESLTDDDFLLTGDVVRLESEKILLGGEVFLIGEIEPGAYAKVRIQLTPEQYKMAYEAHGEGKSVSCRGKLRKEGRYWTLSEIKEFRITS